MRRPSLSRALLASALCTLLLADLLSFPAPARAQVPVINGVLAIGRIANGINRRNRIYQAARDAQQDFDAYYDSLEDTARAQLVSGELTSLRGGEEGPERVRVGAFIKLNEALAAEQAAITRSIDAETNAARREFNRTLVRQIRDVVLQLPGAQQILGEVRTVITNLRTTVIAIQSAAASSQPLDVLTQRLAQQVSDASFVQDRVRNLGSMIGPGLDRALGGALTQVDNTIQDVNREANQAVELLDGLDAQVGQFDLAQAEASPDDRTIGPLNIHVTERTTAILDVASQALSFLSLMQGTGGTTREQMVQQIRSDLLQERNAQLLAAAQHVSQVECKGVGRGEYEVAAGMLGKAPEAAADPDKATYMVCSDRETGVPVRAWIVRVSMPTSGTGAQSSQPAAAQAGDLPLGECDATGFLSIGVPDLGWEENECACSYHVTLTNNHPEHSLVVFSRLSSHMEDGVDRSQWTLYRDLVIGPGESLEDGGTGWEVIRWGGFYSTCQLRDGELGYPVRFSTDRIGAIFAIDGCRWIQDTSGLESLADEYANSCAEE